MAECGTLFAFLQLVFGFVCPLLLLAAQEASIYAVQPPGSTAGAAGGWRCRGWRRDALQRWLAETLARVPAAVSGTAAGAMVATYLLAVLWVGLAAAFGS